MTNPVQTNFTPEIGYEEANSIDFAIQQSFMKLNTVMICQVMAVNNDGTLDLQPQINYLAVGGLPITPDLIFEVPAGVIQGGNAGLIIEYAVGDLVIIGVCQRDITLLKKSLSLSNPGSLRRFNLNDAVVLAAYPKTPPTVFISILPTGITITAPGQPFTVNAESATINVNQAAIGNNPIGAVLTDKSKILDSQGKPCTYTASTTVKVSM